MIISVSFHHCLAQQKSNLRFRFSAEVTRDAFRLQHRNISAQGPSVTLHRDSGSSSDKSNQGQVGDSGTSKGASNSLHKQPLPTSQASPALATS